MTNGRIAVLVVGVVLEFVAVAAILLAIVPVPRASVDYLVIGTLSTFISLATVFAVLMLTRKTVEVPKSDSDGPKS